MFDPGGVPFPPDYLPVSFVAIAPQFAFFL
jgi:hypothetical protein